MLPAIEGVIMEKPKSRQSSVTKILLKEERKVLKNIAKPYEKARARELFEELA